MRVALGRAHHGHGGVVDGSGGADRNPPAAASARSTARSPSRRGQHHLGLGVAEAHVVLEHLGPVGGQHEPGVEHARGSRCPGDAARRAWAATRSAASHLGARPARRPAPASTRPCRRCWARGRRRRCACSPGPTRAARTVRPSARHSSDTSGPRQALLDHDPSAGVAEGPARQLGAARRRRPRPGRSVTSTPLPAARPSVFTTYGRRQRSQEVACGVDLAGAEGADGGRSARRRRRARSFIHAFEPSRRAPSAPGPNTRRPCGAEPVGQAVDQRQPRARSRRGRRRSPRPAPPPSPGCRGCPA